MYIWVKSDHWAALILDDGFLKQTRLCSQNDSMALTRLMTWLLVPSALLVKLFFTGLGGWFEHSGPKLARFAAALLARLSELVVTCRSMNELKSFKSSSLRPELTSFASLLVVWVVLLNGTRRSRVVLVSLELIDELGSWGGGETEVLDSLEIIRPYVPLTFVPIMLLGRLTFGNECLSETILGFEFSPLVIVELFWFGYFCN